MATLAPAENKRDAKSYVNVKGNVQITGNKKGEEDNNLYLPNYSGGVTIRGNLDQTADIRVTTENKPGSAFSCCANALPPCRMQADRRIVLKMFLFIPLLLFTKCLFPF